MIIDNLFSAFADHIVFSSIVMSYALVFVAEIGDKSQIMCMMLAARHRVLPVALGAILSFALLNTLAVLLGATISEFIQPKYVSLIVAVLFFCFGIHSLINNEGEDDEEQPKNISAKRLFFTTFMLITVAEFGDKTQLAVVALGSSDIPLSIFIGATLALVSTTLLGVWAGQHFLKQVPMGLIHKLSGSFFILLAIVAAIKSFTLFTN